MIHKVLFEIKSIYTYDYNGDINIRVKNNLKWKAALEAGYKFIVVWDKKYLMSLDLNDIENIEDSLYLEHKFEEFNKENLFNILEFNTSKLCTLP